MRSIIIIAAVLVAGCTIAKPHQVAGWDDRKLCIGYAIGRGLDVDVSAIRNELDRRGLAVRDGRCVMDLVVQP